MESTLSGSVSTKAVLTCLGGLSVSDGRGVQFGYLACLTRPSRRADAVLTGATDVESTTGSVSAKAVPTCRSSLSGCNKRGVRLDRLASPPKPSRRVEAA